MGIDLKFVTIPEEEAEDEHKLKEIFMKEV